MSEPETPAPILVLVEPQDVVNIGSAVRVAKNFGVTHVRLVRPAVFDPYRIEGIAHHAGDLIDRIAVVPTLAEALTDCTYVAALTARQRSAKRRTVRPREAAAELVERAARGPVAIVAGREDAGLTNEELDQCHSLVAIPTNPAYRSLNLAQAIAIACYESWLARTGGVQPLKPPRRSIEPATNAEYERLFEDWERALWGIEFFKTRQPEHVLRSVRELVFRAGPDARETMLLRAMQLELLRYLRRVGAPVGEPTGPGDIPPGATAAD